ncbi:OLC1v1022684C1 [Oldenlandia corymbosa var. corymbosa]|uniref:OLC1v1022684C1 n=1 Tax=Oldenlandia corymbosa var. corymbosa TaxID=529605 RepID=A0AAV1BYC5_OLDCO|nr:OLC1v1022684C1 [Oldenlandia corymbosa var. corymbosa]
MRLLVHKPRCLAPAAAKSASGWLIRFYTPTLPPSNKMFSTQEGCWVDIMLLLPLYLISEILKKLPVKSLIRSKCVSRAWLSIISDPSFAMDYSSGSRILVIAQPNDVPDFNPRYSHSFICVSLDGGGNCNDMFLHHEVVHGDCEEHMKKCTNIVKGLVCFYRGQDCWMYNITTREMVQLPPPISTHAHDHHVVFHFGFDLVNKRYKLLRTCPSCPHVEILTIGVDSCWRTIVGALSPQDIGTRGASYLGGCLCWMDNLGKQLTCFPLAHEKFIQVPIYDSTCFPDLKPVNFGPNITIARPNYGPNYLVHKSNNVGEIRMIKNIDRLPDIQVVKPASPPQGSTFYTCRRSPSRRENAHL